MATETLRPNAVGGSSALMPVGAAANWDCCDETPSDGDTTYVRSPSTDDLPYLDLYNIVDTAIPAGSTINSITVKANIRSINATFQAEFRMALKKSGSATQYSLYAHPSTAYVVVSYVFTGVSLADLNALQIGIEIASGSQTLFYPGRCTQVWVEIDYTEPGGMASKRLLVGVGL